MLTKEDLRERLFVAEKVMKSLFQRNKELEQITDEKPCERCKETEESHQRIDELEAKIKELETAQTRNAKEENSSSYVEFMKKRLEESQLESKRNLDALIDLRSQFAAHLND